LQRIIQDSCLGLIDRIEGRLVINVLGFSLKDVLLDAALPLFTFLCGHGSEEKSEVLERRRRRINALRAMLRIPSLEYLFASWVCVTT